MSGHKKRSTVTRQETPKQTHNFHHDDDTISYEDYIEYLRGNYVEKEQEDDTVYYEDLIKQPKAENKEGNEAEKRSREDNVEVDGKNKNHAKIEGITYIISGTNEDGTLGYSEEQLRKIAEISQKYDEANGINYTKYKIVTQQDVESTNLNSYIDNVFFVLPATAGAFNPDLGHTWPIAENNTNHFGHEVVTGHIYMHRIRDVSDAKGDDLFRAAGYVLAHERLIHAYSKAMQELLNSSANIPAIVDHQNSKPNLGNENANWNNLDEIPNRKYDKILPEHKEKINAMFQFAADPIFRHNTPIINADKLYYNPMLKEPGNLLFNKTVEQHLSKFINKE